MYVDADTVGSIDGEASAWIGFFVTIDDVVGLIVGLAFMPTDVVNVEDPVVGLNDFVRVAATGLMAVEETEVLSRDRCTVPVMVPIAAVELTVDAANDLWRSRTDSDPTLEDTVVAVILRVSSAWMVDLDSDDTVVGASVFARSASAGLTMLEDAVVGAMDLVSAAWIDSDVVDVTVDEASCLLTAALIETFAEDDEVVGDIDFDSVADSGLLVVDDPVVGLSVFDRLAEAELSTAADDTVVGLRVFDRDAESGECGDENSVVGASIATALST